MACQGCGETVSGRTAQCPNCGADVGHETVGGTDGNAVLGDGIDEVLGDGIDEIEDTRVRGSESEPVARPDTRGPARLGRLATDGGFGPPAGSDDTDSASDPGRTGAARGPGGDTRGAGGDGKGGGEGTGDDRILATLSEELPLLPGALAGVLAGVAVLLIGVGVGLANPPDSGYTTMDVATLSVVDLHFGLGGHIVPEFVLARFEEFAPPATLFGLLYLLPPLFLYTAGKAVSTWVPETEDVARGLLNGTTVVLGYLPVVLVTLLLVPGDVVQIRLATPLLLAGIVYPLLFGGLGGLAQYHYPADARRVGVGYGVVLLVAVALLLFLWSFVVAGSLTIADRLVLTTLLLGAVQAASGLGTLAGAAPLVILAGLAALATGFVRTLRADPDQTLFEGVTRPLTAAWTYGLGLAVVVTAIPVFADGYAAAELRLGSLVADTAASFAAAHLATNGDFAVLVVVGTVLYPVVLGGLGGLAAGLYRRWTGAGAEQAGEDAGRVAGTLTGGSSAGAPSGGSSTGAPAGGPAPGGGQPGGAEGDPLEDSDAGGRAVSSPADVTASADPAESGGAEPDSSVGTPPSGSQDGVTESAADRTGTSDADEPAGPGDGTGPGEQDPPSGTSATVDEEFATGDEGTPAGDEGAHPGDEMSVTEDGPVVGDDSDETRDDAADSEEEEEEDPTVAETAKEDPAAEETDEDETAFDWGDET